MSLCSYFSIQLLRIYQMLSIEEISLSSPPHIYHATIVIIIITAIMTVIIIIIIIRAGFAFAGLDRRVRSLKTMLARLLVVIVSTIIIIISIIIITVIFL